MKGWQAPLRSNRPSSFYPASMPYFNDDGTEFNPDHGGSCFRMLLQIRYFEKPQRGVLFVALDFFEKKLRRSGL